MLAAMVVGAATALRSARVAILFSATPAVVGGQFPISTATQVVLEAPPRLHGGASCFGGFYVPSGVVLTLQPPLGASSGNPIPAGQTKPHVPATQKEQAMQTITKLSEAFVAQNNVAAQSKLSTEQITAQQEIQKKQLELLTKAIDALGKSSTGGE